MTAERNMEHALQRWLVDGVDEMPDRVYLSILDRVDRQPQQRAWRVSWRDSHVNSYLKPLLAVAAIVVVAVAGFAILRPSTAPIGGPIPTGSPPTTPAPSDSPAAVECEEDFEVDFPGCEGPLVAGTHTSTQFQPGFSYETTNAALGDWLNVIDMPEIFKIDEGDPYDPYILMWSNGSIVDQTDQCGTNPDPNRGRKAADWIEFVTNHPALDASEPVDVPMGGVTAKQVELTVAHSWTYSCPGHGSFYVGLLTQPIDGRRNEYGLPSSQRQLMTVVDVGDKTVVMQSYAPVSATEFAGKSGDIRDVIASFRFE